MRGIPSQLVLFVSLGFAAPMFGAKPVSHPVAAKKVVATVHAKAEKPKSTSISRSKVVPIATNKRSFTAKNAKIDTVKLASRRTEPPPAIRREPPAPIVRRDPDPETEQPITVRHDRKQHFSADPVEPSDKMSQVEPLRKATSADFLVPFSAAGDTRTKELVAGAEPGEDKLTRPHKVAAPPPVIAQPAVVSKKAAEKQVIAKVVAEPVTPPIVVAMHFDRKGRVVAPPAMKGSHEILVHQNEMADSEGLDRVQDDDDLARMREAKLLVAVPIVAGLQSDERLPGDRRYVRPWTAKFLADVARAHYAKFHSALQVNSAVRTVAVQERLIATNGNAAPVEGATASPHLTGQAVDLAKHGLSMTEIAWLRGYLMPLVQQGKVDVEEEFQQACFHISVYKKYVPGPAPKREIVAKGRGTALAVAVR